MLAWLYRPEMILEFLLPISIGPLNFLWGWNDLEVNYLSFMFIESYMND